MLTQGFTQDVTVAKALRVDPSRITKVKAYLSLNNALPFDGLRKLTQALSLNDLLGLGSLRYLCLFLPPRIPPLSIPS